MNYLNYIRYFTLLLLFGLYQGVSAQSIVYEYLQIVTNSYPIKQSEAKGGYINSEKPNIEIMHPNGKTDQEYDTSIASIITQFSDEGWELFNTEQAVLSFGSKNVVQMRYFFKREKKVRTRP